MKKYLAAVLCVALLTVSVCAAGGTQADPVVSESYLNQVWEPSFLTAVKQTAQKALAPQYIRGFRTVTESVASKRQAAEHEVSRQTFGKLLLKKNDVILPMAGCKLLLLDGSMTAEPSLINVTNGIPAENAMVLKNLYMQNDKPSKGLTVTSDSAELRVDGSYTLRSAVGVDYGSMAQALETMGLFKGVSDGYMLSGNTTRAQGLVMFLRLLGLEQDALTCQTATPFTDMNGHWAKPYVAYAYENGLTSGTSATKFSPDAPLTAQHYITFLMRALQYHENTEFLYKTVLTDCVEKGLFAGDEIARLSAVPFRREQMVYLSYYALACADHRTNQLLLEQLIDEKVITKDAAVKGLALVRGGRLK